MNPSARRRLFVSALLFTAATAHAGWFGGVQGSGHVATESRAVAGFQAIDLRGSMNLVLRQGGREGVELRGDDNVLPLVETRVVDHGGVATLEICTRHGDSYSTASPVVVTVDLKTLSALRLAGSGDVTTEALKTPALRIGLSGSGNLRLRGLDAGELTSRISGSGDQQFAGHAARAAFAIAGSGDVDAGGLEADDVKVDIAGAGDAKVVARKTLTVSVAGSGDVVYAGDPVVHSSVAGSGSVRRR